MTTTRTDVHRPTDLDPDSYTYLGAFYQGDDVFTAAAYRKENIRTAALCAQHAKFRGNHDAKGTCDHCGVLFAHGVAFLHVETDEVVRVGHQCAESTFGLPDRAAVVRRNAAKAAKAEAAREAKRQWAADNAHVVAWVERNADKGDSFAASLRDALYRYGTLTERQTAAVERTIQRAAERAAERAAARADVAPVETGNAVVITGTVATLKWQDSLYGETLKCRIVTDSGAGVWGTVPSCLADITVGERITFTAAVEASSDDPSFGFFKRPRKASRVA